MNTQRKLLVVDDSPDNLELLTELLRDKYRVYSYGSSDAALLDMLHIRPDLLVLDIRMFPMNGVDFLRTVRQMKGFAHVPAIAVTALAREVEKQSCLDAGFQVVVTKPILDVPKMKETIEGLLQPEGEFARVS